MPPPTQSQLSQSAYYLASLDPDQRAAYQEEQSRQARINSAITGGAGIADIIGGGIGQRRAEDDIDMLGAEGDSIREQMKNLKAPGAMDSETTAAAVRNATILGGVSNEQDDSSELAAAKMAIDAGGDPANIQRALTEANERKDATERNQQQGAFREGLGYAQEDALAEYNKGMQGFGMDYDENQRALQMAQTESLNAQNQKQGGVRNAVSGGMNFLQNGGIEAISGLFGEGGVGGLIDGLRTDRGFARSAGVDPREFVAEPGYEFEEGGVVQKTPGAFKHDDGDGVYEDGENEMILMAQKAGGLVDTGIRQTGGEFVINPKQAKGMEKAYDKINKKKKPSRQDLMALYEAVRFLDEPQFD